MKTITVIDLMVPLKEYATVLQDANLAEAVSALEKAQLAFDPAKHKHRAILVLDEKNKVVGKLGMFDILMALIRHQGRVLSRLQILEETQGVAYDGFERTIDQHVKNLRRKLRATAGDTAIIQTVYGVGYRLDEVTLN